MATDEDVTATLRCSNVDQGELEQLFLSFFGSGAHPSPKENTHGRQGAGVALRVLYNNDGKLQKVLVGPNALPDDVEQFAQQNRRRTANGWAAMCSPPSALFVGPREWLLQVQR
jgi:hypothetical protein